MSLFTSRWGWQSILTMQENLPGWDTSKKATSAFAQPAVQGVNQNAQVSSQAFDGMPSHNSLPSLHTSRSLPSAQLSGMAENHSETAYTDRSHQMRLPGYLQNGYNPHQAHATNDSLAGGFNPNQNFLGLQSRDFQDASIALDAQLQSRNGFASGNSSAQYPVSDNVWQDGMPTAYQRQRTHDGVHQGGQESFWNLAPGSSVPSLNPAMQGKLILRSIPSLLSWQWCIYICRSTVSRFCSFYSCKCASLAAARLSVASSQDCDLKILQTGAQ